MSKYEVFSGSCFPVFSPNTGKYGPGKTPYLETFHAVPIIKNLICNEVSNDSIRIHLMTSEELNQEPILVCWHQFLKLFLSKELFLVIPFVPVMVIEKSRVAKSSQLRTFLSP